MVNVAIFADDLTGACDTGVKLIAPGKPVEIIVDTQGCGDLTDVGAPTVSVNTNTRSVSRQKAKEKLRQSMTLLTDTRSAFLYKKVDSVLRGNIGAELGMLLELLPVKFALVAPAYPKNGRVIVNGRLTVQNADGISTALDALETVGAGGCKCAPLPIECVRQGPDALVREIRRQLERDVRVFLADTQTEEDFEPLTRAVLEMGPDCLPVGSAGWIPHLWSCWQDQVPKREKTFEKDIGAKEHVLFVMGSCHPVTTRQIQWLYRNREVSYFHLEPRGLTEENMEQRAEQLAREIRSSQEQGTLRQAILITSADVNSLEDRSFQLDNVFDPVIMHTLALVAQKIMGLVRVDGLSLCGGDVADCVLVRLGITKLRVLRELEPGIVMGWADTPAFTGLITTKSGGFGTEQTLDNILRQMTEKTVVCF